MYGRSVFIFKTRINLSEILNKTTEFIWIFDFKFINLNNF